MRTVFPTAVCLPVFCLLAASACLGAPLRISTGTLKDDFAFTPLEFEIRGVPDGMNVGLKLLPSGEVVPSQVVERSSSGVRIAWLAPRLAKGTETLWEMALVPAGEEVSKTRVEVKKADGDALGIAIDGAEFTRLLFASDQHKPYFFPIMGPSGRMISRQFPMVKGLKGEDQDHPHQRSLWFTHGSVGGADFWAEGPDKGTIRQTAVSAMESGPVFGRIRTSNEWITPKGEKILDDRRTYTFYPLEKGEVLLDFFITLTPAKGPIVFGDTKEGSFGIRLAESMKEKRGGFVVNSRGQRGTDAAWGKPAEWVDYSGPIEKDTVGVAIFDHPKSFRHPTTWHVRNYGLFAANPFGYREFEYEGKDGKKSGDFTLEPGQSMEFRYRLYFHHGKAGDAPVAEAYRGFASPPDLHPKG